MNVDKNTGLLSSLMFKRVFNGTLGDLSEREMQMLFMKIDINSDDLISWDDFSSYMLLRSEGQKLMRERSTGEFDTDERKTFQTPHKEMILRVRAYHNNSRSNLSNI